MSYPPEDRAAATIEDAALRNSQRSRIVFTWLNALLIDHAIFRLVWSLEFFTKREGDLV